MVNGIILRKREHAYTYLKKLFDSIAPLPLTFKWLISYPECYPQTKEIQTRLDCNFCILSGKELIDWVNQEDFQWIWGTLSAFDPMLSDQEILNDLFPESDLYNAFWKNPLTLQHPLATMEIVAFDSSCTLILTKDFSLPETFWKAYPYAEDLERFNART